MTRITIVIGWIVHCHIDVISGSVIHTGVQQQVGEKTEDAQKFE